MSLRVQQVPVLGALLVVLSIAPAHAQGVSVLNPLARSYGLRSFAYIPPAGDGWREAGSAPDAVRLVYAEDLGASQVDMRADFTAQAFEIDDPTKVADAMSLTRLSLDQRLQEKGEDLVALSPLQPIAGTLAVYQYTLVVKVGEDDQFEDYFVALAPDKSQYLAAKLVTKDADFRDQQYYRPLLDSLAALAFPSQVTGAGEDAPASTASSQPDAAPAADEPSPPESDGIAP